jgi:predicted ATPase/DNA-binding CsgD family transcriptional regulator
MGLEERASILPAGTVTFLLADLERPGAPILPRVDEVLAEAVAGHGGVQPGAAAEGERGRVVAAFPSAAEAVAAALDAQRALHAEAAPGGMPPSVRVALHTGEARLRDDRGYAGPALDRCARLRDVAHGGQVLLTSATAAVVADALPDGAELVDLGVHRLRDLSRPERVHELRHPDLDAPDTTDAPDGDGTGRVGTDGADAAGGDRPRRPLRSLDALANNLPIQLTSFVGRSEELAAVELLLDGERLVTLTGAGGSGKTRLGLHAAAELADRWPDGVWWVDLSSVADPALVPDVVATTAGVLVEPVGGPLRSLTVQLRDRRVLLCLDNCEHLLAAAADLVEALLRSCPEVSVLATSREPLDLPGETVWRVPSMVEGEAMSLFVERASHVRPWFTLDETNEDAVRRLCQRLDGMPLAIELAAAWLRTLTPAQIAAGLDDRFALLVRGARGVVARHQTLAASIDWSHDLLDETDQVVFRRLAAFSGGFSLDAARAVCGAAPVGEVDVLVALGRLVDKSLVVMEERADEARYRLLETIRQYALGRLEDAGETALARDRHLDHFVAVARVAEPGLVDVDQDTWLARLEADHDNLRAALDWGLAQPDPDRARRLASVLIWLWYLRGHTNEGIDFLQRAIGRAPDERSPLQALLLAGVSAVSVASGQFDVLVDYAQRSLELAVAIGDDSARGRALLLLGVALSWIDFDGADGLFAQGAEASAAAGDAFGIDRILVMQGVMLAYRDRHDEAFPVLQEGLERSKRRGDRGFAASALAYQAVGATLRGDLARAEEHAVEGLEIARPRGDFFDVGLANAHVALVKSFTGDIDAGRRLMEPIVQAVEGTDRTVYVPDMALAMGRLSLVAGDCAAAKGWFERDVVDEGPMADSLITVRCLPGLAAALRHLGRLDEAAAAAERGLAAARRLGVPHLEADALDEQAHLAARTGDPDAAEGRYHRALAIRVDHGFRTGMVDSLEALAALAAPSALSDSSVPPSVPSDSGDPAVDPAAGAEAVRLLAAADAARTAIGYARAAVAEPDRQAVLAALRDAVGDEGFAEAWSAGAALSLDEAVALVRRTRGTRRRPSTGWASLTPTELDVARCVVDGLSNPQIGDRLFMGRGTVKTHLSHIYAKLGIANRTELATLASRHLAT